MRLRIGKSVYSMHASVLEDPAELRHALALYNAKYKDWIQTYYGFPITEDNVHDLLVPLRLVPRRQRQTGSPGSPAPALESPSPPPLA